MKIPLSVIRLLNPLVSLLLRSPLHGLLSKETMLITFTGRKSGRAYTTPVSYVRDGDRVRLFTTAPWLRNLIANPSVILLLQRREYRGSAEVVVDDAGRTREALRDFLQRVPRDDPYFNHGLDGEIDGTQTFDGKTLPVVLIEIRLAS